MAIGTTVWGDYFGTTTLKGTEVSLSLVQSFLYLVSSSINVSIFLSTCLGSGQTSNSYCPLTLDFLNFDQNLSLLCSKPCNTVWVYLLEFKVHQCTEGYNLALAALPTLLSFIYYGPDSLASLLLVKHAQLSSTPGTCCGFFLETFSCLYSHSWVTHFLSGLLQPP